MNRILWVDSRTGSKELLVPLQRQGIDAREAILDSADFAFTGNGPDGPAEFGVERKALSDFVDSARTGRLYGLDTENHESQLTRMLAAYDFAWVLLEGHYGTNAQGRLIKMNARKQSVVPGGFSEDSLNKTLLSLDLRGGVRVKETNTQLQTVRWLASLFRSHTDKLWSDHTTFRTQQRQHTGIKPVSTFRGMVMQLSDIGLAASKAVERHCLTNIEDPTHSLASMLKTFTAMSLSDWENLDVPDSNGKTRKFGTARALSVMETLRRAR